MSKRSEAIANTHAAGIHGALVIQKTANIGDQHEFEGGVKQNAKQMQIERDRTSLMANTRTIDLISIAQHDSCTTSSADLSDVSRSVNGRGDKRINDMT